MNTYYHNPRCSKSRAGLELLQEFKIEFTTKEYLVEKMEPSEVTDILSKLSMKPQEIMRIKEDIYQELELDSKTLDNQAWIETIINHPKLLERPIFVTSDGAVIGRPTEKLEYFLKAMK